MKRIFIILACLLILLTPAMVFAETSGQKQVRELGYATEWINLGIDENIIQRITFSLGDNEDSGVITVVYKDGSAKSGYIDKTGKPLIPAIYDGASHFTDGLALVMLGNKKLFIDKTGREVLDVSKYEQVQSFYRGYATFYINDKCGVIDLSGKEIVPCIYDYISVPQTDTDILIV